MNGSCTVDSRSLLATDIEVVEGNPFEGPGRKIVKPSISVTLRYPDFDVDRFLTAKPRYEVRVTTGGRAYYGAEMYISEPPEPVGHPGTGGAYRVTFTTDHAYLR